VEVLIAIVLVAFLAFLIAGFFMVVVAPFMLWAFEMLSIFWPAILDAQLAFRYRLPNEEKYWAT